ANSAHLREPVFKALADLQNGLGRPRGARHGIIYELHRLFSVDTGTLTKIGLVVSAYAVIEGVEAVGLWYQQRWAEYLTLIATTLFIPLEIYELTLKISPFKITALVVNTAIVIYLLYAKRLFGFRGGVAAEEEARRRDTGQRGQRSIPTAGAGGDRDHGRDRSRAAHEWDRVGNDDRVLRLGGRGLLVGRLAALSSADLAAEQHLEAHQRQHDSAGQA